MSTDTELDRLDGEMAQFYRQHPTPWEGWTAEQQREVLRSYGRLLRLGPLPAGVGYSYLEARRRAVHRAGRDRDREFSALRRRADRGDREARQEIFRQYREPSDCIGRPIDPRPAGNQAAGLAFRAATGFEPFPMTDHEWAAQFARRRHA